MELHKKLYELTRWKETKDAWVCDPEDTEDLNHWLLSTNSSGSFYCPYYDTDYLLDKLPDGTRLVKVSKDYFVVNNVKGITDVNSDGKTPVEALLKFANFLAEEKLI